MYLKYIKTCEVNFYGLQIEWFSTICSNIFRDIFHNAAYCNNP